MSGRVVNVGGVVEVNQVLIFSDNSPVWIRIVVDGGVAHNLGKSGVLDLASNSGCHCVVFAVLFFKVDFQRRSLDVLGHIDDFFESWDSKCHILG